MILWAQPVDVQLLPSRWAGRNKFIWCQVRPPHGFRLLSRLWGDHFKWTKKTHLTLSSIPPFIVTILAFAEYAHSLISRPDQFCNGKYLAAPTFVAPSIQRVFMGFLWFFKLSHNMFHLFPDRIKNRMFENRAQSVFFQLLDKQKVT